MTDSTSIVGYVDVFEVSSNSILIEGWAVYLICKCPVDYIEINISDKLYLVKPQFIRSDVVSALGDSKCAVCGFKAIFPLPFANIVDLDLSVHGIYGKARNKLILVCK